MIVLLQWAVCVAVCAGMVGPSCVTNDQCGTAATFCGGNKACDACGGWRPGIPLQVDPATGL